MDAVVNQAAKMWLHDNGAVGVPLVLRLPVWGLEPRAQHGQCTEAFFMHTPGLKVVCPSMPADAKGLLLAAIRDPNPVLCFESHHLYGVRGPVPEGDYTVAMGKAIVRREGKDLTIVTCGGMVLKADAAAEALKPKGIDVEIVDLRSLAPLDKDSILKSVAKTKRAIVLDEGPMLGGVCAEIAALVQENLFSDLKGPVLRVGAQPIASAAQPAAGGRDDSRCRTDCRHLVLLCH